MRLRLVCAVLWLVLPRLVLGADGAAPEVSIEVGDATAMPGQRVMFDVVIEHDAAPVATQNELAFPPLLHVRSCAVNPAIEKGSSRLALLPQGCTAGIDCNSVRALIFAFEEDPMVIPTGAVLYSCTVDVDAAAPFGAVLPITCSDPDASTADAALLATSCSDGTITVSAPVVSLDLGTATAAPGGRAAIPLTVNLLRTDVELAGVQTRLRVSEDTPVAVGDDGTPDCTSALSDLDQQSFGFTPAGCAPDVDCSGIAASIMRAANRPIEDGSVVFTCTFRAPIGTPPGSYPIGQVAGAASATDAAGAPRAALTTDGAIVVRTSCVGDCDGNGLIPVSELITGVNVLLDRAPLSSCQAFDRNRDGKVTVDELVAGIAQALRGCGDDSFTTEAQRHGD